MAAVGTSLLDAFQRLETLDFYARTLLRAKSLGTAQPLAASDLNRFEQPIKLLPEFSPSTPDSRERELRQQIVEITRRAYDRHLMTSTAGVVSARLDAWLAWHGELPPRGDWKQLADQIGVSPEALYREMARRRP